MNMSPLVSGAGGGGGEEGFLHGRAPRDIQQFHYTSSLPQSPVLHSIHVTGVA
jgi:hypothetical protein